MRYGKRFFFTSVADSNRVEDACRQHASTDCPNGLQPTFSFAPTRSGSKAGYVWEWTASDEALMPEVV